MQKTPQLSDIKLVASDMDGTLLNSKSELSPDFYPIYHKLKEFGVKFVAASGRQLYNLQHKFGDIADEMTFIAENGAYIMEKGREMHIEALSKESVIELLHIARQIPRSYIMLCGRKKAYIDSNEPEFMDIFRLYVANYATVDKFEEVLDDDIFKVTICDMIDSSENSYTHFKPLSDRYQVKVSGKTWLDVSTLNANKGYALDILQKSLGISKEETMVFGDYENDLEMMGEAYFSYAMANARPAVKAVARFEAPSNDEKGVLQVLQKLIDSRK